MKFHYLLLPLFFLIAGNIVSQNTLVVDDIKHEYISTFETITQRQLLKFAKDYPNFSEKEFNLQENNASNTMFDFSKYLKQNKNQLFEVNSNLNKIIISIDSTSAASFRVKTEVIFVSILSAEFEMTDLFFENSYCLKMKEVSSYYYNGELKSTNTVIHYYWYTEMFTNYLLHYTQVVLQTPNDILTTYNEFVEINSKVDLEKKHLNSNYSEIIAYPNPITEGVLKLKYLSTDENPITFELFNITNNVVGNYKILSNKGVNYKVINVEKLANGFYILRGRINNTIFSKKIIIE